MPCKVCRAPGAAGRLARRRSLRDEKRLGTKAFLACALRHRHSPQVERSWTLEAGPRKGISRKGIRSGSDEAHADGQERSGGGGAGGRRGADDRAFELRQSVEDGVAGNEEAFDLAFLLGRAGRVGRRIDLPILPDRLPEAESNRKRVPRAR